MNTSNNFNVCPHCSNHNMINAKYCSRCGHELKLPQEPIVCPNCHARNAPIANYCRNCGAELKMGAATKICTRCNNEVPVEQSVCSCGYVFAQPTYATPIPVRADGSVSTGVMAGANGGTVQQSEVKGKKLTKEEKKQAKLAKKEAEKSKKYSHKGGRAFAIIALIFLLAFAYFIIVPSCVVRPSVISGFDKGIINNDGSTVYGYDLVMKCVSALMNGAIADVLGDVPQLIMTALVVIFALTVLVHLIVCIVRACKPKRSRKPNWFFFTLAIITTIAAGLIAVFNMVNVSGFLATIAGYFKLADGWSLGYVLYAIPIFYWFFFLYSLIAKARVMKEQTVAAVSNGTVA